MVSQIIKASGWTSLRKGLLDYYQCPECNALSEALFGAGDTFKCFTCKKSFPIEAFKQAQAEETFAICAECGDEMALTPYRQGFVGYTCLCENYVAIPFENELCRPQDILALPWNKDLPARGVSLKEKCWGAKCKTARDWEVIAMLQVLAKQTNSEFMFAGDENDALLAFDLEAREYIGYLMWYEGEEYATLNQLFVVPEQRRKGYAESMVTHWVQNYARHVGEVFALESPNEHAVALHLKLGHLREEGEQVVGIGCFLVSGL